MQPNDNISLAQLAQDLDQVFFFHYFIFSKQARLDSVRLYVNASLIPLSLWVQEGGDDQNFFSPLCRSTQASVIAHMLRIFFLVMVAWILCPCRNNWIR